MKSRPLCAYGEVVASYSRRSMLNAMLYVLPQDAYRP